MKGKFMDENLTADNVLEVADQQTEVVETTEVQGTEQQQDITQTQMFSKRLKEEKQKAVDAEYERLYGQEYGIRSKSDYDTHIRNQELIEQGKDPELYALKDELESFKYERNLMSQDSKLTNDPTYGEYYKEWKDDIRQKIDDIHSQSGLRIDTETAFTLLYKEKAPQIIKELKQQLEVQTKNKKNAATDTGSVTGNGNVESDFITHETFEANKHDRNWMVKNLSRLSTSRAKW